MKIISYDQEDDCEIHQAVLKLGELVAIVDNYATDFLLPELLRIMKVEHDATATDDMGLKPKIKKVCENCAMSMGWIQDYVVSG